MENLIVWLFWAVIIGGSIASSASKAKKKREEEARKTAAAKAAKARAVTAKTATPTAGPTTAPVRPAVPKPATGGTFGRVLEELSRQLTEQPSPTVAEGRRTISWPARESQPQPKSQMQPVDTYYDHSSLEQYYDAMDGREYRGDRSAESFEDEVGAYERLAKQRAQRSSLTETSVAVSGTTIGTDTDEDRSTTLHELLGGDFDLRRAVVEAEILTPKWERPRLI
jgi:hypothetical protein